MKAIFIINQLRRRALSASPAEDACSQAEAQTSLRRRIKSSLRIKKIAGIAGILTLASCGQPGGEAASLEEDLVSVKVLTGVSMGGMEPRSITATSVEGKVDAFEVVFRTKSDRADAPAKAYYRGEGGTKDEYITVNVYPGIIYDVLLLAGKEETLLAAGYRGGDPDGAYGGPVTIKAGEPNEIKITMKPFPPQWKTGTAADNNKFAYYDDENTDPTKSANDFVFSVTGLSGNGDETAKIKTVERYIQIGETMNADGSPGISPAHTIFKVSFNISKLDPLIAAEAPDAARRLTFAAASVKLRPFYADFGEVYLLPSSNVTAPEIAPSQNGTYIFGPPAEKNYISFANSGLPANADAEPPVLNGQLPVENVYGFLDFQLDYHAFGTADSGGQLWRIRNGLDKTEDNGTGDGGSFLVLIGGGGGLPGR
ncbi:MAG: hypothetical protein LBU18_04455 [Treponema sp.]|jgi:hypothetical protein|nr:hypothetical protein [Treponema sp.]